MKIITIILYILFATTACAHAEDAKAIFKTQFSADKLIPAVEKQNSKMGFRPLEAQKYDCELAQDEPQSQLCSYKFNADNVFVRYTVGNAKAVERITVDLGDKTNRSDFDHLSAVMVKLVEPKMTDEAVNQLLFNLSTNALSSGVNVGSITGKNAHYSLFVMGNTTQMLIDPKESKK